MYCAHCHDKIPHGLNITLDKPEGALRFCCNACLLVYQLLQAEQQAPKETLELSQDWQKDLGNGTLAASFYVEGMHCKACAQLIELSLQGLAGVHIAKMDYPQKQLNIIYQSKDINQNAILHTISELNYKAWPYQKAILAERQQALRNRIINKLTLAVILAVQLLMFSLLTVLADKMALSETYAYFAGFIALFLSIALWFYCAIPVYSNAFLSLTNYRLLLNSGLLVCSAALIIGAVIFSHALLWLPAALFCPAALLIHLRR